jgi:hypothetical protein
LEKWLERFKLYLIANDMKDENENKDAFLLLIGEDAYETYKTLKKNDNSDTLTELYTKLSAHFVGKRSQFAEQCRFINANRLPDETIDDYHMRLRSLAAHCNYGDTFENRILERLVPGSRMLEFQQQCCRTEELTLKTTFALASGYEQTAENIKALRTNPKSENASVSTVSSRYGPSSYERNTRRIPPKSSSFDQTSIRDQNK